MNACWCILAGTEHCKYCKNNLKKINEQITNIPYKPYSDWNRLKPYKWNTTTITTNSTKKYENPILNEKIFLLKELNRKEKKIKKEKQKVIDKILKLLETLE